MIKQIIAVLQQLIPLMQQLFKRKQNEEMVRRICRQEQGLTEAETMDILGTIAAESSFDDKAIGRNTNGSVDYGIIQANSYWYIEKMKLLTKDEALNDPEKCVRVMIKRMREGFLKDWYGYRSKAYYAYLKKGSL